MLPLVPSQRAARDRLKAALRFAGDVVILVGAPGQGKSHLLETLILETPVSPLFLKGQEISSRADAITQLAASVGLLTDADEAHLLTRLHQQKSKETARGAFDIAVDPADALPDAVLLWLSEMAKGRYGESWSVLLVGDSALANRAISLGLVPSQVVLPRWDVADLESAWPAGSPGLPKAAMESALAQLADRPGELMAALTESVDQFMPVSSSNPEQEFNNPRSRAPRRRLWIFLALGAILLLVLAYGQFQATHKPPPVTPTIIPLNSGSGD